jgi:hypothetical protein
MKRIHALLAAGLLLGSLNASALNLSDLWWNPQQPGTGLQVVQQGETAFVTLFTYGGNGEPFWVVAPASPARRARSRSRAWCSRTKA